MISCIKQKVEFKMLVWQTPECTHVIFRSSLVEAEIDECDEYWKYSPDQYYWYERPDKYQGVQLKWKCTAALETSCKLYGKFCTNVFHDSKTFFW